MEGKVSKWRVKLASGGPRVKLAGGGGGGGRVREWGGPR